MNVAIYTQRRQYGSNRSKQFSQKKIENFLESKLTKSFVNKACEISGRCRSTFVMKFSHDGTKVASTHGDHSVRVTEIATGKCLHTLTGHPRTPWSLAYHPSYSNILASGCLGGQVRIWDLYGHGCEVWNTDDAAVVAALTFHPTDKVLVIAAGNTVYFWDWTEPQPFAKCSTDHEYERIRWIQFDSLGQTLYTGISNNTAVHRDELSNMSRTREEVGQLPDQSPRGSLYSNIVSYYQDFRRDRLLRQLGPVSSVAGNGQQSTSVLISTSVTPVVTSGGMNSTDVITSSSRNTLSDIVIRAPDLSSSNPETQTSRTPSLASVSDAALSRLNLPVLDNTEDVEIPLESVTGQYRCPPTTGSILSPQLYTRTIDTSAGTNLVNRICSIMSNSLSEPRLSTSTLQSIMGNASAQRGFLQRSTREPVVVTSSSSSSQSKVFRSIRDRLQSSVPLSGVSSTDSKKSVSSTQSTGIPKVTIIMNSHTESNPRESDTIAQRSYPSASGSTAQRNCNVDPLMASLFNKKVLNPTRENSTSATPSTSSVSSSDSSTQYTSQRVSASLCPNSASNRTELNLSSLWQSSLSSVSRNSLTTSSENQAVSSSTYTMCVSAPCQSILNMSVNSSTAVTTAGGLTSVYRGIFPSSTRAGSYLSSHRLHPYNQHNRSRNASLIGPNLLSTGGSINVIEETPVPDDNTQSNDSVEDAMVSNTGQTSIGRENESVQLSTSHAYFLPIPERQLSSISSVSSTNLHGDADRLGQRELNLSSALTNSSQGRINNERSRSDSDNLTQQSEVELLVNPNDNASTNRNISSDDQLRGEIVHSSQDRNNNSIHMSVTDNADVNNNPGMPNLNRNIDVRDPDYLRLRNSFVTMTDQIEREMNDLNRRINALRDSFNESIRSLRHDRHLYQTVDGELTSETATNLSLQGMSDVPDIPTILDGSDIAQTSSDETLPLSHPPTLLESSLRTHTQRRFQQQYGSEQGRENDPPGESQHWRSLRRHYLHPHYSSSILDDTINRPNNMIQSAINRAIAGAFMSTGEAGVANNIISQTHRIQYWDFTKCLIPDIRQSKVNIIVPHCKLHNTASADISQDNTLLATFVPNHNGLPDNNILAVYSLIPATRGQCFYTKQFGPNAVSVSISPTNNHVLVCLAAKRLTWVFATQQLMAHIYKFENKKAGENSLTHVKDVYHTCNLDVRAHVSGNSACWLPIPGQGLVYGTNRGDLHICRPGTAVVTSKAGCVDADMNLHDIHVDTPFQRSFGPVPWRLYANSGRVSTATQTARVRHSAGTQTLQDE